MCNDVYGNDPQALKKEQEMECKIVLKLLATVIEDFPLSQRPVTELFPLAKVAQELLNRYVQAGGDGGALVNALRGAYLVPDELSLCDARSRMLAINGRHFSVIERILNHSEPDADGQAEISMDEAKRAEFSNLQHFFRALSSAMKFKRGCQDCSNCKAR